MFQVIESASRRFFYDHRLHHVLRAARRLRRDCLYRRSVRTASLLVAGRVNHRVLCRLALFTINRPRQRCPIGAVSACGGCSGYLWDEIVIVAATTSTETVLPRLIAEDAQGRAVRKVVVGFVIPAGYSFNLDGTCLYLDHRRRCSWHRRRTHISTFWHELGLIAVLLLTSKGAAGIAGAAFVVLAATLIPPVTVPVASIALILGIHRILAEGLTFVNLIGNALATVVVAKWEGKLDEQLLATTIGNGRLRARHQIAAAAL